MNRRRWFSFKSQLVPQDFAGATVKAENPPAVDLIGPLIAAPACAPRRAGTGGLLSASRRDVRFRSVFRIGGGRRIVLGLRVRARGCARFILHGCGPTA